MIIIMTDEELIEKKRELVDKKRYLESLKDDHISRLDEMYVEWRAEKDPKKKRLLHEGIFVMKDSSTYTLIEEELRSVDREINRLDLMLYSSPSPSIGNIYVNDGKLNYEKIELYGIHGCKL